MYDTRLVLAAQQGDEAAFAALVDRNVDGLYDLCWALTGDTAEASRLVTEAFSLAASHIDDITDASQLRPWLLAIARDRVLSEDEAGTLKFGWGVARSGAASLEPLGTNELRRWVREAAATLALADQVVVELSNRFDLDSDELAAAIGCAPEQLDDIVGEVSREATVVLGALVLARQGRQDCPELAQLLEGWDGAPAVDIADAVERHARTCAQCTARQSVASPLELLAAAPLVPPPTDLRLAVLEAATAELSAAPLLPATRPAGAGDPAATVAMDAAALGAAGTAVVGRAAPAPGAAPTGAGTAPGGAGAVAAAGAAATARGTPAGTGAAGVGVEAGVAGGAAAGPPPGRTPPPDGGAMRRWGPIVGIGAAVVVLLVVIGLALRGSPSTKVATSHGPTTTAAVAPGTSLSASAAAPQTVPQTLVPIDSSSTTSSTVVSTGSEFELNTTGVEFGSDATSAEIVLTNVGNSEAGWHSTTGVEWLTTDPSSGFLEAGQSSEITLSLDRSAAPAGAFDIRLSFVPSDSSGLGASVVATGTNAPAPSTTTTSTSTTIATTGPAISDVGSDTDAIEAAPCPLDTATVRATVTDPAGVASVVVTYSLPDGKRGSVEMTAETDGGATYTATIGDTSTTGDITYAVTATDSEGITKTSDSHTITVNTCPV